MQTPPDYYAVLGLKPGSSLDEVKTQYRRLAKLHHPDLNNNDARSQEKIRLLNLAYEYLLDPERKASYDVRLRYAAGQRPDPVRPQPPPDWKPQPTPGNLRPLRLVFAGGRSFVVPPRVILAAFCIPGLIAFLFFLDTSFSFVGSAVPDAAAASRFHVQADRSAFHPASVKALPPPDVSLPFPAGADQAGGALNSLDREAEPLTLPPAALHPSEVERTASPAGPLRARCAAALPKADAAIAQGDRLFGENEKYLRLPDATESQQHRACLARMERDLGFLRTQRVLLLADLARLQWVGSREEMQRAAPTIQIDLKSLDASLRPVRKDLQVLRQTPRAPVFASAAPVARPAKHPFNPHLSSRSSDEPQFSMPTEMPQ